MRPVFLTLAAAIALPTLSTGVRADCSAEIAALFRGGPLDPFARPNRRETIKVVQPDGSESPYYEVLWDGPARAINCFPGSCVMMIGDRFWTGPDFEGPWTPSPSMAAYDPEEQARTIADDLAANLTDASCEGMAELNGQTAMVYRYRSRTNPDASESWFGGLYTAYIGVETRQLLQLEEAESISHWAPDPSPEVRITTVVYDPSIEITPPED